MCEKICKYNVFGDFRRLRRAFPPSFSLLSLSFPLFLLFPLFSLMGGKFPPKIPYGGNISDPTPPPQGGVTEVW